MHHHAFLRSCRELLCFGSTIITILVDDFGFILLCMGVYLLFTPYALYGKRVLLLCLLLGLLTSGAEWCLKRWSTDT